MMQILQSLSNTAERQILAPTVEEILDIKGTPNEVYHYQHLNLLNLG